MIRGPFSIIKLFHWSLVASVVFSWLAADDLELWHEWAGYVALGLIAMRLGWSLLGPKSASLGRYSRGAKKAIAHMRDLLLGRGPRKAGVFPFVSLSVILLLITVTATSLSGWLLAEPARLALLPEMPSIVAPAYADDDDYKRGERDEYGFGGEALEEIHEFLANFLLLLIFAHVAGIAYLNTRNKPEHPPARTT